MPITEKRIFSDETQAAFVARHYRIAGEAVLMPEALFSASTGPNGDGSRLYLTEGFGFGTGALYRLGKELPHMLIDQRSRENAVYINFPDGDSSSLTLGMQHGKLNVRASYYYPEDRQDTPELLALSIEDTSNYDTNRSPLVANTGALADLILSYPNDYEEILDRRGATYDRETGIVTLKYKDMIVRAKDRVHADEILERYFPPELRQDRLHAGIELDVWARSDWMKDFGIDWNREVVTEIPIFEG